MAIVRHETVINTAVLIKRRKWIIAIVRINALKVLMDEQFTGKGAMIPAIYPNWSINQRNGKQSTRTERVMKGSITVF